MNVRVIGLLLAIAAFVSLVPAVFLEWLLVTYEGEEKTNLTRKDVSYSLISFCRGTFCPIGWTIIVEILLPACALAFIVFLKVAFMRWKFIKMKDEEITKFVLVKLAIMQAGTGLFILLPTAAFFIMYSAVTKEGITIGLGAFPALASGIFFVAGGALSLFEMTKLPPVQPTPLPGMASYPNPPLAAPVAQGIEFQQSYPNPQLAAPVAQGMEFQQSYGFASPDVKSSF